jgi:hypothetical protein
MKEWVSPNTTTGSPAVGSNYFDRKDIEKEFWRRVKCGEHIRFLAPRRVGKTSIMKRITKYPEEGYVCFYENIQSVKSMPELFERIFEMVLKCANKGAKAKTWLAKVTSQFSIKEITATGVKFDRQGLDFVKELFSLLESMTEVDEHVILFLDEFPEVINKLRTNGKAEEAKDILHKLRELRQTGRFENFTMVIAGSIGLEFVVKKIARPNTITDIKAVRVGALSHTDAKALIQKVTKGASLQYNDAMADALLAKVGYALPYYIQLMLDEIDTLAQKKEQTKVTKKIIDEAFENIIRYNRNLEDWYTRLTETYDGEFKFLNEVLIACAKHNKLAIQQIADIALPHNLDADCVGLMDDLCNDGYLIEDDNHIYSFVSPFLQAYWKRKFRIL